MILHFCIILFDGTLHSRCTLWHYMNYGKEQVLAKLYAIQYALQDITYLENSGAALKTVSSLFKSMNSSTAKKHGEWVLYLLKFITFLAYPGAAYKQ